MPRIGLLSDTHNYLDEQVFEHFKECDEIWHAGDFGSLELADRLAAFKPLRGVYGNIDDRDVRLVYPEVLRFKCEEVEVMMVHIGGYPGHYSPGVRENLYKSPPQLFISGHSHILKVMNDPRIGSLHMNPGAAGRHGWHKIRTLLRFSISEKRIHTLEVIELGKR